MQHFFFFLTYLLFNFLQLVALFADVMQQLHCLVILSGDLYTCLFQASLQALKTYIYTQKLKATAGLNQY